MKNRFKYLLLPMVTLVLEILPYGAVLNFMLPSADGTTVGRFRELYSYFDLLPFGYANFAPLITAIITCIILLLLVIYCITGKRQLIIAIRNVLCVCAIISLGPLVLGIRFISVVGALISISLIAELLLLHFASKAQKNE